MKHTFGIRITKVRTMTLITSKIKTKTTSTIIAAQEPTTKTMETKAKEISIYAKNNHQEKPVNVSVTLNGPISKEQLYNIQEVLRHPSQYWNRLKPEDQPATGEYTKSFNKFCPKKVEVNEATVEEAIKFDQYLKRSEEDTAKAIDIYKSLRNDTFYGPKEEPTAEPQEQQDQ